MKQGFFFKLLTGFVLIIAAMDAVFIFKLGPQAQRAIWLGSGLAVVLSLLLAGVGAYYATSRLIAISNFAQRIAEGDLTARMGESSTGEFGELSDALDRSASNLESNFSALQNGQRQLEIVLNSMQDAVIAVDAQGRVRWANQTMDELVPQHTRLNSLLVETVRDPDLLQAVKDASHSRKVFTARAGSIVPSRMFEVTAAPMPGGGAVAVLRDLTETERIEKTRRDFIANVSHELRTPLTSIQGYAETLLETAPESYSREFLEIIRKNSARMSRLTEDLLTLARVESGEQRFDPQPVMPGDLLQEAAESFRESSKAQHIELQINDAAFSPVNADPEAIHQVFANLIENALKYAASGGRVVVGARPADKSVEFFVQDSGPGISSKHLPRLFERFYRVDEARSRESGALAWDLRLPSTSFSLTVARSVPKAN